MNFLWIMGHLLFLSVEDIRDRQLSVIVILEFGCTGIVHALSRGHVPQPGLGILLLCFAFMSREQIGYGDGWLILALGMWMTAPELLQILFLGMGCGILYGLCFGKRELPLVPFLTVAYVIGEWI